MFSDLQKTNFNSCAIKEFFQRNCIFFSNSTVPADGLAPPIFRNGTSKFGGILITQKWVIYMLRITHCPGQAKLTGEWILKKNLLNCTQFVSLELF